MPETLVTVEQISKKFCRNLKTSLWYGVKDIAAELLGENKRSEQQLRRHEFWAVNDVSFELRRGECLGLIGHNGAGKSTLLKILNGLIKPDRGRVVIKGRVGALIELGAGFNPILTGRENVYVNGSILGLSKSEIARKLEAIVEFSEIGEFIDTPVQYYSSGMRIRLGFAIAAQLEPDVLLVDEVLAVGDIGFVLKCFNKMDALLKNTGIILVSHNIPQVTRMSTSVVLMEQGKCVYNSQDVSTGILKYYESFRHDGSNFVGSSKAKVKRITLKSGERESEEDEPLTVRYGDNLDISIELVCNELIEKPSIWLIFHDKTQRGFAEVRNFDSEIAVARIEGTVVFTASLASLQFAQGSYSITVALMDESDGVRQTVFRFQSAAYFNVSGIHQGWAPVQLAPKWQMRLSRSS